MQSADQPHFIPVVTLVNIVLCMIERMYAQSGFLKD